MVIKYGPQYLRAKNGSTREIPGCPDKRLVCDSVYSATALLFCEPGLYVMEKLSHVKKRDQ